MRSTLVSVVVVTAVLGSGTAVADPGGAHARTAPKRCRHGFVRKHGRCVRKHRAPAAIRSGHFGNPVNSSGQYHYIDVNTAKRTATFAFRLFCQGDSGFSTLSNSATPTTISLPSTRVGQAATFSGSSPADSTGATTTWSAAGKFTAPATWSGSISLVFDLPAHPENQTAGAHCQEKFPNVTMSIGDPPLM